MERGTRLSVQLAVETIGRTSMRHGAGQVTRPANVTSGHGAGSGVGPPK
jgi:hypothetical protein